MKHIEWSGAAVALLLASPGFAADKESAVELTKCDTALGTVAIVDGDTFDTAVSGRVRIVGVNTPERGQCGYDEATGRLAELLAPGSSVTLELADKVTSDRYGRTLAYPFTQDGLLAGAVLVQEGLAKEAYFGDNDKYRDVFLEGQENASQAALGGWGACGWSSGQGVVFDSCAEASAAGAVPLTEGDAGYNARLDGDGDGTACEQS